MTVGIDQDRYDQPRMVGMLAKMVILLFQLRCIDMLEDIFKNETVVIRWKQVKNVRWEHQVLVKLNGAIFKF